MVHQDDINALVYSKENTLKEKLYVCGFLFTSARFIKDVALIRKKRPAWQAGLLNGIGGKVEQGESPYDAMVREFNEEAGAHFNEWRCFALLMHEGSLIFMFTGQCPHTPLSQMTDERVGWYGVNYLFAEKKISNLNWLIPLALSGNRETAIITDPTTT